MISGVARFGLCAAVAASLLLSGCASAPEGGALSIEDHQRELSAGEDQSDSLSGSDPVGPISGAPYRVYRVPMQKGEVLYTVVESVEFTPRISIFAPDERLLATSDVPMTTQPVEDQSDGFGGVGHEEVDPSGRTYDRIDQRTSAVTAANSDGDLLVVVSSNASDDFGAFHVGTEVVPGQPERFELFSPITGYLHAGKSLDPSTEAPADTLPFELEEPAVIEAEMTSPDFLGHISIVDADTGTVKATSEQTSDGKATLLSSLPAGDYELLASSISADHLGEYRLETDTRDVDTPESFVVGEHFDSYVGLNNAEIPSTHRQGEPLEFELDEDRLVDVEMMSDEVDSYLVITDDRGRVVAEDDDSGDGVDAHIRWPLEAGQYTLWATTYGGEETGSYTVESSLEDFPPFEQDEVQLNTIVQGRLETDSDIYDERDAHVEFYELDIEESTGVRITMRSEEVDSYLVLYDEDDELIDDNDDWHPFTLDARVEKNLEPGTYRIGATTFGSGETGVFTLETEAATVTDPGDGPFPDLEEDDEGQRALHGDDAVSHRD